MKRRLCLVVAAAIGGMTCASDLVDAQDRAKDRRDPPTVDLATLERVLLHQNRGIAFMERFQPEKAIGEFRDVVRLVPRWHVGRLNLSIALLNSQVEDDLAEAEKILRGVIKETQADPRAFYSLGMILLHRGEMDDAAKQFEATHRLDPSDSHTLYQLGSIARQRNQIDQAEALFRKVIALNPGFASAYYGLGRILVRRNPEEGRRYLNRFRELEQRKVGVKIKVKYSEMGPYADIIRLERLTPAKESSAQKQPQVHLTLLPTARTLDGKGHILPPAATAPTDDELEREAAALGPAGAVGDFNGDEIPDVFIAAGAVGADRLYLSREPIQNEPTHTDVTLQRSDARTTAAAAGDYDGDGDLDLFLASTAGCLLLKNDDGAGGFVDVTALSGLGITGAVVASAKFADADHDGDLDLLLAVLVERSGDSKVTPGKDRLFINLGTGRFRDDAAKLGLASPARSRSAFFADLDGDDTLDIFIGVDGGPNRFFRNGRALFFREHASRYGIADPGPVTDAFAADLDGDGYSEVIVLRGPDVPPILYRNERVSFQRRHLLPPGTPGALAGCVLDLDRDGALDVFIARDTGAGYCQPLVFRGDGHGALEPISPTGTIGSFRAERWISSFRIDQNSNVDLLVLGRGSPPTILTALPPKAHRWLTIKLSGKHKRGESFSNARGIGAKVEVKSGDGWTIRQCGVGGNGDDLVRVGLGPRAKADYIRILWPDGALQSEMEIAANQTITIDQVVRKASSCPILFSWDGTRFRFITDFIGTGGLGFLLRPGEYPKPDPTEDVRIPPGMLTPHHKDGRLLLRVLEPLEEVCYLDSVELLAIDHAAGSEAFPEERFGGVFPAPHGRILLVDDKRLPSRVLDDSGRDVTELLHSVDRRWVTPTNDVRYIGFVNDHALTFEFDELRHNAPLRGDRPGGELFLFLDGWVEYTYSHVNYAAFQAGLTLTPPSLEVPTEDGSWKVAITDIGYPAGLPRTMVIPLPAEVRTGGQFRLRTNMQIYWDRAFIARDTASANTTSLRVHRLKPAAAKLRFFGFPREFSPDGMDPPLYAYDRKDHGVYFRMIPGDYTRFGDVDELLLDADDRFVIFGRGDEIALEFDPSALPPVATGQERTFVLRSVGFCKDRDFYSAHSDRVEPLPFRGMSGYPYPPSERYPDDEVHSRYRQEWNTRRIEK